MTYTYNDGGRKAAEYKGNATQRERRSKSRTGVKTARSGIPTKRKWFKDYMKALEFE